MNKNSLTYSIACFLFVVGSQFARGETIDFSAFFPAPAPLVLPKNFKDRSETNVNPEDKEQLKSLLINKVSTSYIQYRLDGGKIAYLTGEAGGSLSQGTLVVTSYLSRPCEIKLANGTDVTLLYGVGTEARINFNVKKGRLSTGQIFNIGIAAESKQLSGNIIISQLGIQYPTSSIYNNLLKFDLGEETFDFAKSALDGITGIASLNEKTVVLTPQVFAVSKPALWKEIKDAIYKDSAKEKQPADPVKLSEIDIPKTEGKFNVIQGKTID